MNTAYLTKNIAHCEERIGLLALRIARAKKADSGLDQGNSVEDLEERLKGLNEAQAGFERDLAALS